MAENPTKKLDFSKMDPLDMLATVASHTLKQMLEPLESNSKPIVMDNKTFISYVNPNGKSVFAVSTMNSHSSLMKKQSKKQHVFNNSYGYAELKNLSTKSLIDRFSEANSDEMNKKYSYKCQFGKCDVTCKSFGSEKKAFDQIKSHLYSHLEEMKCRNEAIAISTKTPVLNDLSIPSGSIEKSPKKAPKSNLLLSESCLFPRELESHKRSASSGSEGCPAKKMLKFHSSVKNKKCSDGKKSRKEGKEITRQSRRKKRISVFVPKVVVMKNFENLPSSDCYSDSICEAADVENEVQRNDDPINGRKRENDKKIDVIKKELGRSLEYSRQVYTEMLRKSLGDHDYLAVNGEKIEEEVNDEQNISTEKTKVRHIKPQFIIKTPQFPYIHVPLLFELAEIIEIGTDCNPVERMQDDTSRCSAHSNCNANKRAKRISSQPKKLPRSSKKEDFTGSILECVENRVSVKSSEMWIPKNALIPTDNNVENMENMQKVEKEMALKWISKLNSKKKKQYQGPLICQICEDKSFTALATLLHHYRSHAGIKPYSCNICNSTFTRQHSLNYHMLIHNNQSRFSCDNCKRTFRHPSHYREHLRRHTGETPFRCVYCDLHFKTRNTYKRHLKLQHKKLLTARGLQDIVTDELSPVSKR